MILIKLDEHEVNLCKYIGEQRSMVNRSNNIHDAKIGSHNGVDADIQGFMAEYAFAKHINVFPDFGITPRSGSCDGTTRKGRRYDIKSTCRKNGNLLSTLKVNEDIDYYVLAYVYDNIVEFIGYAHKTKLIKKENIKDLGYGKVYFLSHEMLKKFNCI
jgi:hypothetical protein